jgi:hypothetical protein
MISKFRELFRKDIEKYNDDLSNKTITKVDTKEIDETCTSVENYADVLQYICANVHRSIALSTYLNSFTMFGLLNLMVKYSKFSLLIVKVLSLQLLQELTKINQEYV